MTRYRIELVAGVPYLTFTDAEGRAVYLPVTYWPVTGIFDGRTTCD